MIVQGRPACSSCPRRDPGDHALLIILALIIANAFFAAAEISVVALRGSQLQQMLEGGRASARAVHGLRADPERFLATVQVGITLVSATAAAFGGASVAARLTPALVSAGLPQTAARELALAIVVIGISYATIVLGELVPKSLALRNADRIALALGRPLALLSRIARPAVWLLTATSNLLLRPFGDRTTFTEARVSREELEQLVEEARRTGAVDARIGEIAQRTLEFEGRVLSEVMVPRSRIEGIPRDAQAEDIKRLLLEHGHTRMPVYEGTLDEIVGYITARDVLAVAWEGELIVLEDLLRPAYYVPETMSAARLLRELQRRRQHLAIVVDEHGGVSGLVTMEDLIEELVGEIYSEHEEPEQLIAPDARGGHLVWGHAPIREVNRALGATLPEEEDWSTVAGLVIALAGRIPEPGARLQVDAGTWIEVVEASPHRVQRVRIVGGTSV